MENSTYIYTLEYPEGNIRYVGKANDPEDRLRCHIKESEEDTQTHKKAWINGLLKSGNKPILNVVEEVTEENWSLYEQYWISQFRAWGFDLVNSTIGGDGYVNSDIEVTQKMRSTLLEKYASGEIVVWNKGTKGISTGWEKGKKQTKEHTEKARKTRNDKLESGEIQVWNKGKTGVQEAWNKGMKGFKPVPWYKRKSYKEIAREKELKIKNNL